MLRSAVHVQDACTSSKNKMYKCTEIWGLSSFSCKVVVVPASINLNWRAAKSFHFLCEATKNEAQKGGEEKGGQKKVVAAVAAAMNKKISLFFMCLDVVCGLRRRGEGGGEKRNTRGVAPFNLCSKCKKGEKQWWKKKKKTAAAAEMQGQAPSL